MKTRFSNYLHWFLLGGVLVATPLRSPAQQGSTAALNGRIADSQGAVIPGAEIVATETSTSVSTTTTTTGAGLYSFPTLPPGRYRLQASHAGFREASIVDIPLRVAQMLTVDMKLEIGQAAEKVTVSGDADLLETSTAQLSHYITRKELETWPVPVAGDFAARDMEQFVFQSLPGTTGDTYVGSIDGSQAFSQEVYMDGISLGTFETSGVAPSIDALAEFNVQVGAMGAQYNGGGTSVLNYSIRSGTNKPHGTLYEFLQNEDLNANSFANKQLNESRPKQRLNNFGGTVSGPIYIPKVYDGRNKTFFFISEEHAIVNNLATVGTTTIATSAMRSGDLSGYLNPAMTQDSRSGQPALNSNGSPIVDALGRPIIFGQVYNPATERLLTKGQTDLLSGRTAISSGLVREPFTGNMIPTASFDPVAAAYLKQHFPTNYANNLLVNNVPALTTEPTITTNDFTIKLDHQLTDTQRLSFLFATRTSVNSNSNGGPWAEPGEYPLDQWHFQHNPSKLVRVNDYWSITPKIVNHLGAGYNRYTNIYSTPFDTQNWGSTLGIQNTAPTGFPTVSFTGGIAGLGGTIGTLGDARNGSGLVYSSTIGNDELSFSLGAHQLIAGTEWRFYRENDENISTAGTFAFSNAQTDDGLATTSYAGNAFASFLLGQVNQTSRTVYDGNFEFNRREVGTFIQDNWKVAPKLTLNLGVRWEVMGGITEAHGQITTLNPALPNAAAGNLPGALQFARQLGRKGFERTDWGLILPRFGFAYSVHPSTVLRGGFGVNTQAPVGGPEFNAQYETHPSALGFSGSIQVNQSTHPQPYADMAVTTLSTPYPSYSGSLPNYDPTQANGQAPPSYMRPDGSKATYYENYNLGIQQGLGHQTVLEVNYVGNIGKRIYAYGLDQLNQLPIADLSKYGDALLDPVAAHPEVPIPYIGFSTNNTVQQALAPFPQYAGGTIYQYDYNVGWSRYDSLQTTLTRHVSSGFNVIAAYTWSKVMTDTNSNCNSGTCSAVQDVRNLKLEKAVALGLQIAQQFKLTAFYELPFGAGRRFVLHGPANWIAGGWTLSGNAIYQSGLPLNITDSGVNNGIFGLTRPNYTGRAIKLNQSGAINVVGNKGPLYLNPAAFTHVTTSCSLVAAGTPCNNVALTAGNVPSALGTVYAPGLASENASLIKDFRLGEGRGFQFRADATNVFNRSGRGAPVTDINNPSFGQILNNQYSSRVVQVVGRFSF